MGFKIGICGVGRFARCFIPLFKAHPLVDEVVLADLIAERATKEAEANGIERVAASLDELCDSDVDAIGVFSQRDLHGAQSLQALQAGKHVYCSVPMTNSGLDELEEIVRTVERTQLVYMTGETSYYYPSTLYCRERFEAGDFGRFVYAEAQYMHDMDHFYASFQHSGGPNWKRRAGLPPMYYPTHSLSMILSVTGAHATQVSCLGYRDRHEDGIFRVGANNWDNVFSNESALMRTSDGGVIRVNEMRRVGFRGSNSVYMSFYGEEGSFEESALGSCFLTKEQDSVVDLTEELKVDAMVGHKHLGFEDKEVGEEFFLGTCGIHPTERLPKTFKGLPNGHFGSHQFLVDDFCKAVDTKSQPPCHVWNAARWCLPGLVAHESAKREGEAMEIPDYGNPFE